MFAERTDDRVSRRKVLQVINLILAGTAACSLCPQKGHAWSDGGGTQQGAHPQADEGVGASSMLGCTLIGVNVHSAFSSLTLERCTSNPTIDRAIQFEPNVLTDVFGLRPDFACFDDSASPNAFATKEQLLGRGDGTVLFGTNLLRSEIGSPFYDAAVVGIMAHEWAHILQLDQGIFSPGKSMELHADLMAGWYLGWKAARGMRFNIDSFGRSLFAKGDYNFNHPTHHGTPNERIDAMHTGFQMGVSQTRGQNSLRLVHYALLAAFDDTASQF